MMVGAGPAFSVHDDDIFELDGNAVDSDNPSPFGGDDWDLIYENRADSCESIAGDAIAACSFTHDAVNGTIFTTGGSKDEQEVETSWRHTNGAVPAKDDLLDAFAAQYDNGHLYFGADRYATNGDAQIGFWFFHNEISLNEDGTFSGFHTAHDDGALPDESDDTNGDILVLSNFSNGGTVPNIRVFEWYGVNDVRQLDGVPVDSLCGTTSDDVACAITSGDGVTSPWPFDPKSGPNDIFSSGAFYEGGVDLEALGFGGDCFSSFLAETRSSTSITATLKDFVLGGLGSCGVTVTTQVSETEISITTGEVSDTATVTGTGSGSVPNPTGTVDFYLCGPSTTAPACDETTGTLVAEDMPLTDDNPAVAESGTITVTAPGEYCFFALYSGDDNYAEMGDDGTNECFSVSSQPTVATTQSWLPNDSAALDSGGGGALDGTAHFDLYKSDDCGVAGADAPVYSEDVDVDPLDGPTQTIPTANTTYLATSSSEYSWSFSYTSDALGQEDIPASCVEVTTLTIDNDNTPAP
jgi:hypothetical protein